ncbi:MAG: hypothetical protein ABUT20_27205 [Bacteroidota bacterium]
MNRLLHFIVFILFGIIAHSQSVVSGKIYEKMSDSLLKGISVFNASSRATVRSDKDGQYSINASEGDKIIFTGAGFFPDTMIVTYDKLLLEQDITLSVLYISLNDVKVIASYRADSLERRNEYKNIFDQKNIIGGNRPADGVGVSISPFSYFSYRARQERVLKNKLLKDEHESYIDFTFPVEMVERLTTLHGDSLRLFMYRYRPSYDFCRENDRQGMIVYINDKLKEFRKPRK